MKILKLIIPVFIFMLCLSCDSNISNDENNEADIELNEDAISLTGTKWKLSGIVNVETGEIKVLEPKDCEECYTLSFETENKAIAKSINKTLNLDLLHLLESIPQEFIDKVLWMEKYDKDGKDYYDSYTFRIAIAFTDSYSFSSKDSKLFSLIDGEKSYLLFKPIKP